MRFRLLSIVFGLTFSTLAQLGGAAELRLLGRIEISAALPDRSNEAGTFEGGIPANQWGAFGSGIAWLGRGHRYAMVSDAGPADGKASYRCRFHIVDIVVNEKSVPSIKVDLIRTQLLSNVAGAPLVGSLTASQDSRALRFDPEAIRVLPNGHLLISDEYGPSILEFSAEGRQVGQLPIPSRFTPLHSAADPSGNLPPINVRGRQPNRGLECLAVSPKGDFVYALLQSPLIQDGGLDEMNKRVGTNSRLLEINRATGATREYLYPLDAATNGCNDIEYLAPGRFLVIQRDSKAGVEAGTKKIVEIDIRAASDISKIGSLPATALPAGVTPVSKRLFLDLLDPRWKLAGETFPEKIEGIAFGPKLSDGSRVLLITSDNDFRPAPTQIYAFAYREE